ncbi:hypothetical protein O181_086431 [Austropuccinia psidii MF-1]|uniref:J domain-containing protein n=1 Tax=Austropuccinia psidii MF-1 TaxID=1389203 RepID=A0A9Q3IKN5_9BASI|nr:hypothetical protein [Austropuccinia psidii MF-1]
MAKSYAINYQALDWIGSSSPDHKFTSQDRIGWSPDRRRRSQTRPARIRSLRWPAPSFDLGRPRILLPSLSVSSRSQSSESRHILVRLIPDWTQRILPAMDGNREEAQRAFKIAQACQSSDAQKSLKFARKACALYWSPEAAALVRALETGEGPSTSASSANKDSGQASKAPDASSTSARPTTANNAENLRSRNTHSAQKTSSSQSSKPSLSYKPAQLELVKKIRKYKITQYYEILDLKRDCDDSQIKSAYRKLALALHPDKNSAPGADEAFKMVSKAFQILSDSEKRAAFDRHGADPDSRSSQAPSASPFGPGQTFFAQDDGIDPEQIFRMFFGGGLGGFDHPGMQFGTGPTVFQFGGGQTLFGRAGPRAWSQGLNHRRPRQHPNEPQVQTPSTWMTFIPIILFFLISLLQSFPSFFSTPPTPDPSISWQPNTQYPIQRVTHNLNINYFVNPIEFATHPIYNAYLKANPKLGFQPASSLNSLTKELSLEEKKQLIDILTTEAGSLLEKRTIDRQKLTLPSGFKKFEQSIEHTWIRKLQYDCQTQKEQKDNKKRNMMGFLGLRADWDAIRKLDAERIPSCDALKELGYIIE